jgi:MoxR-like ATPase
MSNEKRNSVIYLGHDDLSIALRLCYRAEMLAKQAGAFVRLPAIIWGDPGVGKTSVSRKMSEDLAEAFKKSGIESGYWACSLANKDYVDIGGYAVPHHSTKEMIHYPPKDLPYVNPYIKDSPSPYGVAVLDDVDRAPLEVRNAGMTIMLDRSVNCNPISPNVYVCGTANGESDAGTTSPLGGAFGNRAVHLYLRAMEGWSKFLQDETISSVEDLLPIAQTEFTEVAMCTPRSIEMAKWIILAVTDETPLVVQAVLTGCVGSEAACILRKAMLRTFSLNDILNDEDVKIDAITYDDIEMLIQEIAKIRGAARATVKVKVLEWAKKLPQSFQNILNAEVVVAINEE